MRRRAALVALLLIAGARVGAAQELQAVALGGRVEQQASYTLEALRAMPAVAVLGARERGATSRYSGPLLWPLLIAAKPVNGAERGARLQRVLLARGADGYAVAVAIGELDPNFEGKQVIIATTQDDAPLAAPRLVIPGDSHAGRNVRELVAIDVR